MSVTIRPPALPANLRLAQDHLAPAGLAARDVPGPGCPEPFYRSLGFRHTGRLDEDEVVLELPLGATSA